MSQRRGGQYQYQKITTTTTRTVTNNPINKTFPQAGQKGKIDVTVLKNKNVQFFKCNKCGKLKYKLDEKQTTYESGSMTRKTDIIEKYSKYNVAAKTICPVCRNPKTKCSCKKQRSISVSTVGIRRSQNAGQIDLTPKVKINLNPEKIKKAVEEQRRIAEEEKNC